MSDKFTVVGIGELLWDVFSHHKRPGGAPANFACHTSRLGAQAYPVSCVGPDALGRELREQIQEMGVSTRYIMDAAQATGVVDVVLNAGKPTYEIHEDVAWDHIPFTDDLNALAGKLDAVCFGSLSQRSAESRKTIHRFLRSMPDHALKIFDVNLRQSYFSRELIAASLELASILKLSDEELPVLADFFGLTGNAEEQLKQLIKQFDLKLIAYTRGPDGSLLVGAYEMDDTAGLPGKATDSVGAGDSFTAALCMGLLKGWPLKKVNLFANEVATFVCSQKGATPVLPGHLLEYGEVKETEEVS
ncbi:carbohydrate kinase [Pontiellaceae bacterium B12219]|nr:carbohydrate kinase [Pontiellaceae bacterium B12219]